MIQFTEAIENLLEDLENKEENEISSSEQVLLDAVEAGNLVEEDGLHAFWYSSLNTEKAIKAFDTIGAFEIVDLIQSSQWCCSSHDDRGNFTSTEENHLSEIEEELIPKLEDLSEFIEDFLEE